jgi:hypothetical protein
MRIGIDDGFVFYSRFFFCFVYRLAFEKFIGQNEGSDALMIKAMSESCWKEFLLAVVLR